MEKDLRETDHNLSELSMDFAEKKIIIKQNQESVRFAMTKLSEYMTTI